MPERVLFLCTGNSCRSQMAEGLLRSLGGRAYEAFSAGTEPHGLNPMAVEAMGEIGIDISSQQPESVEAYRGNAFDHVITVCDYARETCPVLPGGRQHHWSFDDPAAATGSRDERMAVFRRVRDEIAARLRQFAGGSTD